MRTNLKRSAALVILAISASTLFAFQNCSPVHFENADLNSLNGAKSVPGSAFVKAGDTDAFPPLKLVFVVDNSGTMQINQINLSNAFGKMFDGDNATNLAPFQSTAYIFNTSQKSVLKDAPIFSKLPHFSLSSLSTTSYVDLMNLRGGNVSLGLLPGDLAGYTSELANNAGLTSVSFTPVPVLGFLQASDSGSSIELGVSKTRDGSTSDFAQAFASRVSVLDPARSEIDPATHAGILDPIVDKESGLCALARVLKKNDQYLQKGDLSAFVVVSDEDDSDPTGLSCVDQYVDYQGSEDLIDGKCTQDMTALSYRPPNPTPQAESCNISYRTAFTYSFKYPVAQTTVSYSNSIHRFDIPKTVVNYFNYTFTAPVPKVKVSYYLSAPTFEQKQTKVSYAKEVETCDTRDGVKINCVYSYPVSETTLTGDFANHGGCSAFVAGKLPGGALYSNAQHMPSCTPATAVVTAGACPTGNPDTQNCLSNYSDVASMTLDGNLSSQSCSTIAAGKLPAGAVYTDAGKFPTCVDASVMSASAPGKCNPSIVGCVQGYAAAAVSFTGAMVGSCDTYVAGKLGANANYSDPGFKPSCAPSSVVGNSSGSCPAMPDPNKLNCVNIPVATHKTLDGAPTGAQTCVDFSAGKLGLYAITDGSALINCSNTTARTVTLTGTQTESEWPGYDPELNSSCSPELVSKIQSISAVATAPSSCLVTAIATATSSQAVACSAPSATSVCSNSAGAKKDCVYSPVPAGDPYLAAVTFVKSGSFACSTLCSDTSFCADKAGTVGDNYFACSVNAQTPAVTKSFTSELASNSNVCAASEKKVVSKGPYRTSGTKPVYVAGSLTENGDPAALTKYIRARSIELFGSELPSVTVFVRQAGDPLGTNGSFGTAYNVFADSMGGDKRSVLSNADGYASSLKSLGTVIRQKLDRSFNIKDVGPTQVIVRAWFRKKGTSSWGSPIDPTAWSASGGTVTLAPDFVFEYGDEFKFDYQ
jgi:hypothetical protein